MKSSLFKVKQILKKKFTHGNSADYNRFLNMIQITIHHAKSPQSKVSKLIVHYQKFEAHNLLTIEGYRRLCTSLADDARPSNFSIVHCVTTSCPIKITFTLFDRVNYVLLTYS